MAYKIDLDLEFLYSCSDNDLSDLVYMLTHDGDGYQRTTESLTMSDKYKRFHPRHSKYWEEIAEEIQYFGGNTFMNTFRGSGVMYREILTDVCDKLKVSYGKNDVTEKIEDKLLLKILQDATDNMSSSERAEFAKELGIKHTSNITPQFMTATFQTLLRHGGFETYKLTVIIANAVMKALFGRGLAFATNATLTKSISVLAGPIGWALTGIWTAIDLAGPAYRVTIPVVIEIACLRRQLDAGIKY